MKIFQHVVVQGCLEQGIPLTVKMNEDRDILVEVPGFYKSGHITLKYDEVLTATDRYGQETTLLYFTDLLALNLEWWERSKDRASTWNEPDPIWADLLERFGFIVKETVTVYKPKSK